MRVQKSVVVFLAIATAGAGQALAQDPVLLMPVYSIEASDVNGVPIRNGPASKITVAPGDVITAKIMIRNWSPQGQVLRAFQAKLDPATFTSGTSGNVQPVGHNPGNANDANAFIDVKDPDFVHHGLSSIPLVDTASEGYRWLNVIIEHEKSPLSKQDSKKYYCGTVKLTPSADATGIFKINLMEAGGASGLLDPGNNPIVPLGFEPLEVEVKAGVKWLKIESSDPPNGAVDGRIALSTAPKNDRAWNTVMLQFNGEVGEAAAADFEVDDGTKSPPKVKEVEVSGSQVLLTLDQPIRNGSWTTIKHKASGTFTRIGRLAGDVSNDGKVSSDDLMVLIRGLNGGPDLPLYRADLDSDGKLSNQDALRMIDLLTQKRTRTGSRLPS